MARRKKSEKLSIEGHASATYSARSLHHLFFPTMTLHFVTIIAIIREEHFTDATTQWADIYIHSGSAYNRAETCAYTYTRARTRTRTQYTRSSTSKFFEYCADPERKSSSFASILLCVLTPRFRVANTFEREPILSERVFPPPCENIGHSNSLSFLITRRFAIVSDRTEYRVTGTHHIMGLNK